MTSCLLPVPRLIDRMKVSPVVTARLLALACALAVLPGCALVKHKAVGMVASTLASGGDVFTRDDEGVGRAGDTVRTQAVRVAARFGAEEQGPAAGRLQQLHAVRVAYLETEALVLGEAKHHDEVTHLNDRALPAGSSPRRRGRA